VSVFIGGAGGQVYLAVDDDACSFMGTPRPQMPSWDGILRMDVEAPVGGPRSPIQPFLPSGFYGDLGLDVGILGAPVWVMPPPLPSGANGRLGFNGFSRDASGGVIAGVTVKCMLTATDTKQSEAVSDANGLFVVSTAEAGGHYLIFYKAGTPDICGTTVNTLLGA
jgi:hypothetical protein